MDFTKQKRRGSDCKYKNYKRKNLIGKDKHTIKTVDQ